MFVIALTILPTAQSWYKDQNGVRRPKNELTITQKGNTQTITEKKNTPVRQIDYSKGVWYKEQTSKMDKIINLEAIEQLFQNPDTRYLFASKGMGAQDVYTVLEAKKQENPTPSKKEQTLWEIISEAFKLPYVRSLEEQNSQKNINTKHPNLNNIKKLPIFGKNAQTAQLVIEAIRNAHGGVIDLNELLYFGEHASSDCQFNTTISLGGETIEAYFNFYGYTPNAKMNTIPNGGAKINDSYIANGKKVNATARYEFRFYTGRSSTPLVNIIIPVDKQNLFKKYMNF